MNINKLEEYFIENYDVVTDVKNIFNENKSENFKMRRLNIKDNNFTGISIKVTFPEIKYYSHYCFYLIHSKKFINHYFFLVDEFDYKYLVLNNQNINEETLIRNSKYFQTLIDVRDFIITTLNNKNYWWKL